MACNISLFSSENVIGNNKIESSSAHANSSSKMPNSSREEREYEWTTDSKGGRVESRWKPEELRHLYKSSHRNNLPPFGVDLSVYDWVPVYNVFLASLPHYQPRTRIQRTKKTSQATSVEELDSQTEEKENSRQVVDQSRIGKISILFRYKPRPYVG